jgi:hypothetical protein
MKTFLLYREMKERFDERDLPYQSESRTEETKMQVSTEESKETYWKL